MAKIILDLCGGTGSWSKPYRDAGYDVRVITLPRYNLFDTQERERLIQFYNRDEMVMEEVNADEVYGIFAAPMDESEPVNRSITVERNLYKHLYEDLLNKVMTR